MLVSSTTMIDRNIHMTVLVTYVSKYGGTRGIPERIAETLKSSAVEAAVQPTRRCSDLSEYEGFVLGSGPYMGSWMKEALTFAREHRDVLASRPTWLFSSGPLRTATAHAQGQDVRETTGPKQLREPREMLDGRDHRVFFSVSDHTHFDLRDRLINAVPAGKKLLIDGDFRVWAQVDAWAIAHARQPLSV
jgi:menaquinone-dependent protoporphyrinogen oxidase